jgi:thymidylate synthase (FAD)
MTLENYDVEVRLLGMTVPVQSDPIDFLRSEELDAEGLIEFAGRLCWDTQEETGTVPDRIQKWIEVGHESMIEHASATFYIRASRVFTHEIVRHRLGSYSQRSQRYVRETEPRYIVPPEISQGVEPCEQSYCFGRFQWLMEQAWRIYGELLNSGIKPEIARYVLPNACETQIICTWNFRELRHIIRLRTSHRALPEMRAVAGKIKDICKEIAPQVFADL